jgi:isopenicillin N synthase-like dioxygenase
MKIPVIDIGPYLAGEKGALEATARAIGAANADMCRRWTNDRWRSAPHRVINKTGEVRYSIPFFFGARADVKLACLPSCANAGNPPKYSPMSFADYLAELEPKNYVLTKAPARAEP